MKRLHLAVCCHCSLPTLRTRGGPHPNLPRAQERYRGLTVAGQVAYPDHVVDIPAEAVDEAFVSNVIALITRLASETPARRVPSTGECRICQITPTDCPERTDDRSPKEGTTDDF